MEFKINDVEFKGNLALIYWTFDEEHVTSVMVTAFDASNKTNLVQTRVTDLSQYPAIASVPDADKISFTFQAYDGGDLVAKSGMVSET